MKIRLHIERLVLDGRNDGRTYRERAPLRLGLAGGGTDLSPYSDVYGGSALNVTIDRFAYAFISPREDKQVVFRANDLGREETLPAAAQLPQATLALHRGVYERMISQYTKIEDPVELDDAYDYYILRNLKRLGHPSLKGDAYGRPCL